MYNHPYEPYNIQREFMRTLYRTLESKKVGIFESPTGTGKTLSLICPAVSWLRESEERQLQEELSRLDKADGPQWTIDAAKESRVQQHQERGEFMQELMRRAAECKQQSARTRHDARVHKRKPKPDVQHGNSADASNYLLDDQLVDEETEKLVSSFGLDSAANDDEIDILKMPVKIYFTSRTHSQLGQLVGALKLLNVPASWSHSASEHVRHVSLGSRKQLCINTEVNTLSVSQINDKCMDMQKSGSKKCKFKLAPDETPAREFRDEVLTSILDIEDAHKLGEHLQVCPYYASRAVVPFSEVVTLPYQLIFQHSARKALDLDLKNSVVIIDEAHNLLDVVSSLYSECVTIKAVRAALAGLSLYYRKVGSRLSPQNRTRVAQTIKLVGSLEIFLDSATKRPAKDIAPGTKIPRSELFAYNNADLINVYEIQEFLFTSKLPFKIDTYIKHTDNLGTCDALVLGRVVSFLLLATDPLSDGKLFFDRTEIGELSVQFLLLDASNQFEQVVEDAKCVILAGGTMEPMDDYVKFLFPYLTPDQIEVFSCGHIVPKENFMVQVVSAGPDGAPFEFTFAKRNDKQMVSQLGHTIVEIARNVPAGMVVFFPSYKHLDLCLKNWKESVVYGRMNGIKKVFQENRDVLADKLLVEYSKQVNEGNGALLLAVVGGKLSEGINFSDDLARAVVMVGLPFPNAFSAEVVAKREHVEHLAMKSGKTREEARVEAISYYESVSLRAVNQSVGRAIRHIKDYAAVFLIDKRFESVRIQRKLSGWIREALQRMPAQRREVDARNLHAVLGQCRQFFELTR